MDNAGSCGWDGRERPRYELCNSINKETLMKYAMWDILEQLNITKYSRSLSIVTEKTEHNNCGQ